MVLISLLFSVVSAQSGADLSVTVVSDRAVVPVNTNITYSITVQNLGSSTAGATFVSVTDNLPSEIVFLTSTDCTIAGSTVTCDIGNIAVSESVVVSYQARALSAGAVVNAVSVTGAETDPNLVNNTTSVSVDIVVPEPIDLALSGSVSPSDIDLSEFTDISLVINNNGSSPAYLVEVGFVLPAQLEFVSSNDCNNSGAVISCLVDVVNPGTPVGLVISVRGVDAGDAINISALVSHFEADPNSVNDGVSLSLAVNEPPPDSADLQLGATISAAQFTVGEDVEITFTVINSGPSDATAVSIIGDLPDSITVSSSSDCVMVGELLVCDIGDLAFNAVYTGRVRLRSSVISPSLTVSSSVVGNEIDPNVVNNVASITLPSVDGVVPTATITSTPIPTTTPIILTATPGATQTPFQIIVTQPVFLTEPASDSSGSGGETTGEGGDNDRNSNGGVISGGSGVDILPDGVAPSDIYGWTRYESIDLIPVTGRWSLRTMQNASDGAYHESRDAGAMLRFPFEGDGFRIGYRSEVHGGSFQILLDGEFLALYGTDVEQIDPELSPLRQTFVTQPYWVTPGYHVVDIVCLSDGEGAQGCNIDYIETFVGPPVPVAPTVIVVPTQAVVVENVELVVAPPTVAPTGTPASESVVAVDVFINVDLNSNSQIEPNEGVAGMSIQAISVANNTTLATSVTDESGFVRISVATTGDVVLLIPILGESFYVRNRGEDVVETWNLILDPATIPGLIP